MEHGHGANCVIVQQGLFQRHTHRSSSGGEVKMTGQHHQPAYPQQSQRFCHDEVTLVTGFGHWTQKYARGGRIDDTASISSQWAR